MNTMQDDIMVSVIVLTYNHEKYICQALDSILMQKVDFKYEILVGDDCSADATPEILLEYQSKYPDKFCIRLRQKNIGATKNAYELHMDARGHYIANLDGDDYWIDANKLAKQVKFLEGNHEFVGCSHPCTFVDEEGSVLEAYSVDWIRQKEIFTLKDFEGLYLPGQISTYMRRNLYCTDCEIDYSLLYKVHPMISDRIAIMLFLLQGDFYCMKDRMSCYRISTKDNITSKVYGTGKKYIWEDCQIMFAMEGYIQKYFANAEIDFSSQKQLLFVKALCKILFYRERGDITLFKQYFNNNFVRYFMGSIPCIVELAVKKLFGR